MASGADPQSRRCWSQVVAAVVVDAGGALDDVVDATVFEDEVMKGVAVAPPACAALKLEIIGATPSPVPTAEAAKHWSRREAASDLLLPGEVTYDSYAASQASQVSF